jgi:hypothetical protein
MFLWHYKVYASKVPRSRKEGTANLALSLWFDGFCDRPVHYLQGIHMLSEFSLETLARCDNTKHDVEAFNTAVCTWYKPIFHEIRESINYFKCFSCPDNLSCICMVLTLIISLEEK